MTDSKPPKGDPKKFQKTIAKLKEQEFVKGEDIIKDIDEGNLQAYHREESKKTLIEQQQQKQERLLMQRKKELIMDLLLEFFAKELGKNLDELLKVQNAKGFKNK